MGCLWYINGVGSHAQKACWDGEKLELGWERVRGMYAESKQIELAATMMQPLVLIWSDGQATQDTALTESKPQDIFCHL